MTIPTVNVFILDDDKDDYLTIKDFLGDIKETRFNLEWEPSYRQALTIIDKQIHDVYLIDYRLGEFSGLDVLDEGKKKNWTKPMILLTGCGDHQVDLEAMQRGAADYLVKNEISVPLLDRSLRYAIKRAEDLNTLREREAQIVVQDRLASIGLLASGLAHEIGTPMGIIRGRAEILGDQLKDNVGLQKNVHIIIAQIDRIASLIQSLLNLARGNQPEPPTSILLRGAVGDVLDLLSHEFSKNQIEVINDIKQTDIHVSANPGAFHQVLLNLLVNSIHAIQSATKQGRKHDHHVHLFLQETENMAILNISDSGNGIAPENIKNLFKPFFTTKDVGLGTGLGLATSYRLVQGWKGTIQVQSELNVGTTFKIIMSRK